MMLQKSREPFVQVDAVTWLNLVFLAVVLLLHHVNYTQDYLWAITHRVINVYAYKIDKVLQIFAVGGFLFLSGFKIAQSKSTDTAWGFIKSRFLRIYPLYFIALAIASFTAYPYLVGTAPSIPNFLIHALCLQSALPDLFQLNYNTIWFVSNLVFCYLLFLLLRHHLNQPRQFGAIIASVLIALYGLRFVAAMAGVKLFTGDFDTYLIFFAIGALYSRHQAPVSQIPTPSLLGLTTIGLVGYLFAKNALQHQELLQYIVERLFGLGAMLPLFCLLLRHLGQIAIPARLAQLMKTMSVASFGVFLFHRSLWAVLATVWSQKSYAQSLIILGLGIPLVFVISYWSQITYDRQVLGRFRAPPKGSIPQS
jgi:peptidoglycan/LPS O-acetylase OafA/YrhL